MEQKMKNRQGLTLIEAMVIINTVRLLIVDFLISS